jgi:hypothetical protein
MWQRVAVVVVALCVPGWCQAQEKRDNLLPPGSQLYLRWDGIEAHQEAADKLAVMKMWKGETGDFVRALWKYVATVGKDALANEVNPELADAVLDEFGGLLNSVAGKGLTLGVELKSVEPLQLQATLIFPAGTGMVKSPLSFMNTMTKLDPDAQIKTIKQGNRTVKYLHAEPIYLAWWAEGKDAVWSVGTTEPGQMLKELEAQKQGLKTNALYKKVQGFNEFTTWMRGYLDLPSLTKVVGKVGPEVNKFIDVLGLDSIQSLSFHSGFDGPAERAVTFIHMGPGPRKGALKMVSDRKFTLKDLPSMPDDIDSFSAYSLNWPGTYEFTVDLGDAVVNLFTPFDLKKTIQGFEKEFNVNVMEVFNALDPMFVTYGTSSEGPLGLGQTALFRIKDEQKLKQELGKLLKVAEKETMGIVTLHETKYHEATIHKVAAGEPGGTEFFKIYYTMHKGWLALALYPQPLKGFILRANGQLPAWTPDKDMQTRLNAFPKEFTGITISDPRPSVKFLLSVLPPIMDFTQMFLDQVAPGGPPGKKFDITLIPNAYEATKHLFPNITVTTTEGDLIRTESRASLMLPLDIGTGLTVLGGGFLVVAGRGDSSQEVPRPECWIMRR